MKLVLATSLTEAQVLSLHALYQNEWWTAERTLAGVRQMLEHSDYVFALCEPRTRGLVAFARVLTDRTFKALLLDVIVAPEHRGRQAGKQIVDAALHHPELSAVKHWELYCLPEMVSFYERWGFSPDVGGVVLLRRASAAPRTAATGARSRGAQAADGVDIRPAGPSDAGELAGLIAGFRDHLRAAVPNDADIRRHLPRILADSAIEFSCAWLDGVAVGYTQTCFFASVWAGGPEARLEDLFVLAGARGREVGRSLLRHAIARAQARGALRFGLLTNERNHAAQRLYRSEGLAPMPHALYPGGREIHWSRALT